jgi:hypothetical protein
MLSSCKTSPLADLSLNILHLVNSTPANWFCKLRGSAEPATCSSEFVAAHLVAKQIMDARHRLCCPGAPIDGEACMFGDDASVITSSNIPRSP